MSQLPIKAMAMKARNIKIDSGFIFFTIFAAILGFQWFVSIPKISGMMSISAMALKTLIGSKLTSLSNSFVGPYILPQIFKFKGVINTAATDEKAVKLTESAVFPLARCVMKLEILPPGQAATSIIPMAILGAGFIIITSRNVIKGRRRN